MPNLFQLVDEFRQETGQRANKPLEKDLLAFIEFAKSIQKLAPSAPVNPTFVASFLLNEALNGLTVKELKRRIETMRNLFDWLVTKNFFQASPFEQLLLPSLPPLTKPPKTTPARKRPPQPKQSAPASIMDHISEELTESSPEPVSDRFLETGSLFAQPEGREHPRIPYQQSIAFQIPTSTRQYPATIIELSQAGLRMRTNYLLNKGTALTVIIEIPPGGGETYQLDAKVVHLVSTRGGQSSHIIGLQYDSLPKAVRDYFAAQGIL